MNDSFRAVNRLLASGEEVRRLATKPFAADGATYPAGHVLHHPQGHDAAAAREDRGRARHAVPRHHATAQGRGRRAQAGARRPVGPLRRLDARRLDAVAAGAVRVPVPGRLPAGTGQGQSAREVRRAHASSTARSAAAAATWRDPARRRPAMHRRAAMLRRMPAARKRTSPRSIAAGAAASPRTRPSRT